MGSDLKALESKNIDLVNYQHSEFLPTTSSSAQLLLRPDSKINQATATTKLYKNENIVLSCLGDGRHKFCKFHNWTLNISNLFLSIHWLFPFP